MNKTRASLLVSFLYDLYQIKSMSRADTFQNIVSYLESIGIDYIVATDSAMALREAFFSNRDKDLNMDQFRVLIFETLKAQNAKLRQSA